jgi:general secretion pathway protein G
MDLISRPISYPTKKWPPPPEAYYLKTMPVDGYNRPLIYSKIGTGGEPFDLKSLGADGVEGGTDENEDLWNHDKRPPPPKKDEPKKDEKKN